ncbi:MAG: hypothetical protein U0841_29300 [Chloroflexia bacterium]
MLVLPVPFAPAIRMWRAMVSRGRLMGLVGEEAEADPPPGGSPSPPRVRGSAGGGRTAIPGTPSPSGIGQRKGDRRAPRADEVGKSRASAAPLSRR